MSSLQAQQDELLVESISAVNEIVEDGHSQDEAVGHILRLYLVNLNRHGVKGELQQNLVGQLALDLRDYFEGTSH